MRSQAGGAPPPEGTGPGVRGPGRPGRRRPGDAALRGVSRPGSPWTPAFPRPVPGTGVDPVDGGRGREWTQRTASTTQPAAGGGFGSRLPPSASCGSSYRRVSRSHATYQVRVEAGLEHRRAPPPPPKPRSVSPGPCLAESLQESRGTWNGGRVTHPSRQPVLGNTRCPAAGARGRPRARPPAPHCSPSPLRRATRGLRTVHLTTGPFAGSERATGPGGEAERVTREGDAGTAGSPAPRRRAVSSPGVFAHA